MDIMGKSLEDYLSRRILCLESVRIYGIAFWEAMRLIKGKDFSEVNDKMLMSAEMKFDIFRVLLTQIKHLEKLIIHISEADYHSRPESLVIENTMKLLQKYKIASILVQIVVFREVVWSYWHNRLGRCENRRRLGI